MVVVLVSRMAMEMMMIQFKAPSRDARIRFGRIGSGGLMTRRSSVALRLADNSDQSRLLAGLACQLDRFRCDHSRSRARSLSLTRRRARGRVPYGSSARVCFVAVGWAAAALSRHTSDNNSRWHAGLVYLVTHTHCSRPRSRFGFITRGFLCLAGWLGVNLKLVSLRWAGPCDALAVSLAQWFGWLALWSV
jgi:hypothetical protein